MRIRLARQSAWCVAIGCLLLLACVVLQSAPKQVAAQTGQSVPAPPSALADKFGVTNWGIDYTAYPANGAQDRLNWGADKVAELGSRTIHVALGFLDIYQVLPPNVTELAQLAQTPAYDKLLRDPRFRTYALTTYSIGAGQNDWLDGFSAAEYAAERDEMRKLGEYLLSNPALAGKTFILFNWESEGAINFHENKRVTWDAMRDWFRARIEGIKLARQKYPNSQAKLFSGLSYVLVRSIKTGQSCGSPVSDPVNQDPLANRCAIDYLAPQLEFDYYGHSAWQTVTEKFDDANVNLKDILKRDLNFALNLVKAKRPEITASNFMLIEYGFERVRYGECAAANYLNELFDAVTAPDAFPLSYLIWWQVVDNQPLYFFGVGDEYFGLYRTRNQKLEQTLAGQVFQKRLANQPVTRFTGCPLIRRGPPPGVLDAQTNQFSFQLNPDSRLAVFTEGCCQNVQSPFSASGNEVHFDQSSRKFILSNATVPGFVESPTQITTALPFNRRFGQARVWVRDARGLDSSFQHLHFTCDTCPQLTGCQVLEAEFETLRIAPGDAVVLNGLRFSPTGNTIVIEQQKLDMSRTQITLPRANILSESTTKLKILLPTDLSRDTVLGIFVRDAQGRESNEGVIGLSEPCDNCLARINPCAGIAKAEAGTDPNYYAGTKMLFRGRFPTAGHKLIVEQTDRQERVYRHVVAAGSAEWNETTKTISAKLPLALFPGRALLYFEDAQGRITRAYPITITAAPVTSVSAANYRGAEIAQASIVAAFGTALATTTLASSVTPLPTELAGTRVLVRDSAGVERAAPLFFVAPTQVNYQVPPGAATGLATVTIQNGFGSQATGTLNLVPVVPSLFAASANGRGLPAGFIVRVKPDDSQIIEQLVQRDAATGLLQPLPVDLGPTTDRVFLVLYGTGFRQRSALSTVSLSIGGLPGQVIYAGAQNNLVGLDQLNVQLPPPLAGRGLVEIALQVEGRAANLLQIAVK